MARWEYIKLYYYHYEDPENDFGFFGVRGPNGHYEQKEIKDLKQTLTQLEYEGWKIEKIDLPGRLISSGRPVTVKCQETFLLYRHLE